MLIVCTLLVSEVVTIRSGAVNMSCMVVRVSQKIDLLFT